MLFGPLIKRPANLLLAHLKWYTPPFEPSLCEFNLTSSNSSLSSFLLRQFGSKPIALKSPLDSPRFSPVASQAIYMHSTIPLAALLKPLKDVWLPFCFSYGPFLKGSTLRERRFLSSISGPWEAASTTPPLLNKSILTAPKSSLPPFPLASKHVTLTPFLLLAWGSCCSLLNLWLGI